MRIIRNWICFALLALMFLGTFIIAPVYVFSRLLTRDNMKSLLHKLPVDEKIEELLIGTGLSLQSGLPDELSNKIVTSAVKAADLESLENQLVDKVWDYIETGEEAVLTVDPVPGDNLNIPIEIMKINKENGPVEKIRTVHKILGYIELLFFVFVGVLGLLILIIFPGNKLFSLVLSALFASLGTMLSYGILWMVKRSAGSIVNTLVERYSDNLSEILKTDVISFDPVKNLTEIGTEFLQKFLDLVNPEYIRLVAILCGSVFIFLFLMLVAWVIKKGFGAIRTQEESSTTTDKDTENDYDDSSDSTDNSKDPNIEINDEFNDEIGKESVSSSSNVVSYDDQKIRKVKRSGEIRFE
ncbi:hypothetical protein JW962_02615 [Candidatus Dojkabacteria bacterium]|nr:hypothetical protein [Candidatus Dojkabacteria bacterium]